MKKRLFSIFLTTVMILSLLPVTAFAGDGSGKTLPYSFDFNTDPFSEANGWTTEDADGDGYDWQTGTNKFWDRKDVTDVSSGHCAVSESYDNDGIPRELDSNNWLFSPAITIPEGGAAISWYDFSAFGDTYTAYVSESNSSADEGDMTVICAEHSAADNWTQQTAELSADDYGGKTVYIAFQHEQYGSYLLLIDNFAAEALETTLHVHDKGTEVTTDDITFDMAIKTVANLKDLFTNGGSGYLAADIDCDENLTVAANETVDLCLNDKVLNLQENHIVVNDGASFALYDDEGGTTRYYDDDEYLWLPVDGKTEPTPDCTITGGIITGGYDYLDNGGGVYVGESGNFTMNGGTISGNTAEIYGGGVYVDGSFTMNGGTISGNTTVACGGGVYVGESGSFTMNGGTISGNTAEMCGGGVMNVGSMTMLGGTITGNMAKGADCDEGEKSGGIGNYGALTLGGTAVVKGNFMGTAPHDVENAVVDDSADGTITIAEAPDAPKKGMSIGLYGEKTVVNNATEGQEKFFFSDDGNYKVVYDSNTIKLGQRANNYWYIDENGNEVELTTDQQAKLLDLSQKNEYDWHKYDWVYVSGNVTLSNQIVTDNQNINLILADGASLTITPEGRLEYYGFNIQAALNVYAQSFGTGELTVVREPKGATVRGVSIAGAFTVYGGKVTITCSNTGAEADGIGIEDNGRFTVNGGEVTITANASGNVDGYGIYMTNKQNVVVNGGKLTITAVSDRTADGIHGGGGFTVNGGEVKITGEGSYMGHGVYGCDVTVTDGKAEVIAPKESSQSNESVGIREGNTNHSIAVSGGGVLIVSGKALATDAKSVTATVETSADGTNWAYWNGETALKTYKYLKLTEPHTHGFTYAVDSSNAATLIANCVATAGKCELTDKKVTLTLTGDLAANAAAVEAWNAVEGAAAPTLSYYAEGSTTPLDAPVKSGKYTVEASVSYGDTPTTVTAELEFNYVSPYWYLDPNPETGVVELETLPTIAESKTGDVEWSGWVFVPAGNKLTITGAVTLTDNVNLILADGAELEITGGITGSKTLTIYGQTNGTGKLTVKGTNGADSSSTGGAGGNGMDGALIVYGGDINIIGGTGGNGTTKGGNGGSGVTGTVEVGGGSLSVTGGTGGNDSSGDGGGNGGIGINSTLTVTSGSVIVKGGNGGYGSTKGGNGGDGVTGAVQVTGGSAIVSGGNKGSSMVSIYEIHDGKAFSGSTMTATVHYSEDSGANYDKEWDGKTALNTFKYLKLTAAHTHSFTYSASGATLTATCGSTVGTCKLTDKKVSLTLTANATENYYVYDNTAKTVDFGTGEAAAWKAAVGSDAPTITYTAKSGSELTEDKAVNAGSYTATVTVDTDKTATLDFTIAKAALTVTANNKSIVYGEAAANDGVQYSGFVSSETASVLGGELTYAYKVQGIDTDYTTTSPVGTYDIIPGGLTSGNYEITFAKGTLTVGQATPTVQTALTALVVYGNEVDGSDIRGAMNVPGSFAWKNDVTSYGDATVESTPKQFSAVFTPADAVNYETVDVNVEVTVLKAAQDAPKKGDGYTISGTTLTAKNGYELFDGTPTTNSFTIVAGKSYSVRKAGDANHFASPYTTIDTTVTVNVLAVPSSMGTVTGGGSYAIGSDVPLTATPNSGYEFVEWQDLNGAKLSENTSYTIENITAGQTLIAAFKPENKTVVEIPKLTNYTYEDSVTRTVSDGTNYKVSGEMEKTDAGTYTVTAKLNEGNFVWSDGTTADKTLVWNIFKATQTAPVVTTVTENSITIQSDIGFGAAEYMKQGGSGYENVTGEAITDLEPGTYYVRYKGDDNHYASPITVVVVSEPTLSVVTLQPSDLTSNGTTLNGVVAPYKAGKGYTAKFVLNGGNEDVTVGANGIFTLSITNLTEDTDYTVIAVVNGTEGNTVTFHTPKAAPVAADNGKIKVNATVEGNAAKIIVSIERGNDVIASWTSADANASHTASFDNLPYGNYNVVVRTNNGHYAETKMLSIVDNNEVTVDFTVPKGKLAAVVDVKPNTPKTAVDGLGEILSTEDKNAAATGSKDVEVKLEVEKKAEDAADPAQTQIKALLTESTSENVKVDFLDMSLLKTTTELMNDIPTSINTENIGATNTTVVEIAVPYDDTSKAPVVLRYHNGMAQELTKLSARPTAPYMDGTYFVGNGYVFIYASGFSTYAIGYEEESSGGNTGGSGGGSSYAVETSSDVKNGKVEVSPKNASAGQTVTITVTPDKGFTLETLTVLDKNGKEVELTNLGNNKYSFKMPSGKVSIEVTFMEDDSMLNFFVDVKAGDYYYDAVLWAAENGITKGTDAVHFSPDMGTTRAQVVTFLWRAAGSPEPTGNASKFTDLLADQYYLKAIAWAIEQGITKGVTDTTFEPETVCTRGQIVTFLARFAGVKDADTESVFSDVPATEFFAAAVKWAKDNGVTSGVTETTFEPYTNCNRAQVVTFLYRWMVK